MYELEISFDKEYPNLQELHAKIKNKLSIAKDDPRKYIYRITTTSGITQIIARSKFPIKEKQFQWKPIGREYRKGDSVRITLLCNVVKKCIKSKKRVPLHGSDAENYFKRKLEQSGLKPSEIILERTFIAKGKRRTAQNKFIEYHSQECIARCVITDEDAFYESYVFGVGRLKSYGYGMLRASEV